MANEQLEKLKHQKYVAEKKLTAAKHKEERLQHELKQLTRSERTHRLCTRAGMLETFLREPTVLTDDDVMELLSFIFHSEAVQKKLNMLIEKRKETGQPDGAKTLFLNRAHFYTGVNPVWVRQGYCVSCGTSTALTPECQGCFPSLRSDQEGCTLLRRFAAIACAWF